MTMIDGAKAILSALGVPERQRNDLCALTLLALCGIGRRTPWGGAGNRWLRIHDVIAFAGEEFKAVYAENSRETIRKQAMHHFRNAAFIEDNGKATNSPDYRYRLTAEMLGLVRSYGTAGWGRRLADFKKNHETLVSLYASKKRVRKMPVKIDGRELSFSPGKHNELQKKIIEEFIPRFAPDAVCLYVGDTAEKGLLKREETLRGLGLDISLHEKMPDAVFYSPGKKWLYFVEAVTSAGPMDAKRVREIRKLTKNAAIGKIFVTAFPDFKTFKRFSQELAWETEVWIAEMPDHMIHLDGARFLGPA